MAEEDRISSLPDHLLLEIISRIKIMDKRKEEERLMSTKEVIKTTTTISKRWRHLWTLLPTLVYINDDFMRNRTYYSKDITNYFVFIGETLAQCPIHVNLKKFKLQFFVVDHPALQVNSWIHYAITRNVQEIDLRIMNTVMNKFCDDELFFNNSCLVSVKLSRCNFNPPTIRWDKLKFLHIDKGELDEDLMGKILSGSPCLETLDLTDCNLIGNIPKSLFGNFGVLEHLSCDLETYESWFSYDDELFLNDDELFLHNSSPIMSMKLSRCVFNHPTGANHGDKLKFLCIDGGELDEDSIASILSRSPFLETLQLNDCCGFRRIDVTSRSVKNLVLSGYGNRSHVRNYYIDTLEINAPYILSLTIKEKMCLKKLLFQNVSSLVKADLNYWVSYECAENFLRGLLSSLGHVNEIALGTYCSFTWAFSRLEATGFEFRKASYRRGVRPTATKFFHYFRSDESIVDVSACAYY